MIFRAKGGFELHSRDKETPDPELSESTKNTEDNSILWALGSAKGRVQQKEKKRNITRVEITQTHSTLTSNVEFENF